MSLSLDIAHASRPVPAPAPVNLTGLTREGLRALAHAGRHAAHVGDTAPSPLRLPPVPGAESAPPAREDGPEDGGERADD